MKKKQIVLILLIIIMSIMVIACTNKSADEIPVKNQNNNKVNTTNDVDNKNNTSTAKITNQEYKDILMQNYEKYLKPVKLSSYDELDNIPENENLQGKMEYIENLKIFLSESKVNIKSFAESVSTLEIKDTNLKELNKKLKEEAYKLIDNITEGEKNLTSVSEEDIKVYDKTFESFIEEKIETKLVDFHENQFEDTLDEIENILGINLDEY